jgi:hypothetical protein
LLPAVNNSAGLPAIIKIQNFKQKKRQVVYYIKYYRRTNRIINEIKIVKRMGQYIDQLHFQITKTTNFFTFLNSIATYCTGLNWLRLFGSEDFLYDPFFDLEQIKKITSVKTLALSSSLLLRSQ